MSGVTSVELREHAHRLIATCVEGTDIEGLHDLMGWAKGRLDPAEAYCLSVQVALVARMLVVELARLAGVEPAVVVERLLANDERLIEYGLDLVDSTADDPDAWRWS